MRYNKGIGYFFEVFVVVVILSFLSAIAYPSISQLVNEGKIESHESELHNIQTAVADMLSDSCIGILKPVGPTDDMNQVETVDTPPLVLAAYLGLSNGLLRSGCSYSFTADGTVTQTCP